jgi:hypothetical protein
MMGKNFLAILPLLLALHAPALAAPTEPGWYRSRADPTGEVWAPPPGIVMPSRLRGYSEYEEHLCNDKGEEKPPTLVGVGSMVQVCMIFRNTFDPRTHPGGIIKVTLPSGLTVIPEDKDTQNGILLQKRQVVVRPGETIFLPLRMLCMNSDRDSSSTADWFRIGPVSNFAPFRKFAKDVENRKISLEDGTDDGTPQAMVWAIGEPGGVSARQKAKYDAWLKTLPLMTPEGD